MSVLMIDGITGCGKSSLLEYANKNFLNFRQLKKYTTRSRRNASDCDHIFSDFPRHSELIIYEDVGAIYCIDITSIEKNEEKGVNTILVCTNSNARKEIHRRFFSKSIYIYRPISNKLLLNLQEERGVVDSIQINSRLAEYDNFLENYISSIEEYDSVILNIGKMDYMFEQFNKIMSYWERKNGN